MRTMENIALALQLIVIFCLCMGTDTFVVPSSILSLKRSPVQGKPPLLPLRPSFIEQRAGATKLNGIPKLFRWLIDLYPTVLNSVEEGFKSESTKIDKFYLDMNGIIHACTHSNQKELVPLNEQEMFLRIFAFTDRLYKLVRPRKLLFLAIDGVAPRAKMNQQRSRRFRSAKEREALLADHVLKEGSLPEDESFDSNCITPGTDFMHRLSIAFRRWIAYKMKTDSFWQHGAEVVFTGPDVPGEGEHKIMDMIRHEQANDPLYAPGKYRHCMYGLDADLIMLSMATHEKHFMLLREKNRDAKIREKDVLKYTQEDFELLEVPVLRSLLERYIENEFRPTGNMYKGKGATATLGGKVWESKTLESRREQKEQWKKKFEVDRIVDDFIFICFLVGNDFIPHLPHMDISDGSLNMIMAIYSDLVQKVGYLTDKNKMHLPRVELLIQEVSRREPLYFMQRSVDEQVPEYGTPKYREHYYLTKFGIQPGDEESIRKVVQSYVEGLAWVLTYYHKGCGSWSWYYPYLYAPLGSDVRNIGSFPLQFERGRPFTPLLQLLSVLPPQSGQFLPAAYFQLMSDDQSPLVDYYPTDFTVDANDKANAWECVVNIPFIEEEKLLDTINKIDHLSELNESEKQRNERGEAHTFPPPFPTAEAERAAAAALAAAATPGGGSGGVWGNALLTPDSDNADRRRGSSGSSGAGGGAKKQ